MDKGITNINLWIAILSSSFVTAIITIIAGWYRHKSEFKNEYYSTIMNKRLTALEHINVITFELSILTNLGTKVVPKFCSSKEDYDRLIVYLGNVNALNLWLTGEMSKKLTEFNVFCVNRIDNEILKSVESTTRFKIDGRNT